MLMPVLKNERSDDLNLAQGVRWRAAETGFVISRKTPHVYEPVLQSDLRHRGMLS